VWATRAAGKYYADSSSQRQLHIELLASVRKSIAWQQLTRPANRSTEKNGLEEPSVTEDPMDTFIRATAGRPLLYGVCLQKQHLDPTHYPNKLRVPRRGFQPYLYSLIGSWGPLLFPQSWQAFKEWWLFMLTGES
jgi:hypothetical protein